MTRSAGRGWWRYLWAVLALAALRRGLLGTRGRRRGRRRRRVGHQPPTTRPPSTPTPWPPPPSGSPPGSRARPGRRRTTARPRSSGAEIYVVSCGQLLESCSVLVDGVMEGAEAIGWDATLFDTGLDFTKAGDAVRQAMAAGADGAIVVGVDCQHFTGALDEAQAADFPVDRAQRLRLRRHLRGGRARPLRRPGRLHPRGRRPRRRGPTTSPRPRPTGPSWRPMPTCRSSTSSRTTCWP